MHARTRRARQRHTGRAVYRRRCNVARVVAHSTADSANDCRAKGAHTADNNDDSDDDNNNNNFNNSDEVGNDDASTSDCSCRGACGRERCRNIADDDGGGSCFTAHSADDVVVNCSCFVARNERTGVIGRRHCDCQRRNDDVERGESGEAVAECAFERHAVAQLDIDVDERNEAAACARRCSNVVVDVVGHVGNVTAACLDVASHVDVAVGNVSVGNDAVDVVVACFGGGRRRHWPARASAEHGRRRAARLWSRSSIASDTCCDDDCNANDDGDDDECNDSECDDNECNCCNNEINERRQCRWRKWSASASAEEEDKTRKHRDRYSYNYKVVNFIIFIVVVVVAFVFFVDCDNC